MRKYKRRLFGYHKQSIKRRLYYQQAAQCKGCLQYLELDCMTIDHIFPLVKGGSNHFNNLQLMCRACNSRKSAKSMKTFLREMQKIRKRRKSRLLRRLRRRKRKKNKE